MKITLLTPALVAILCLALAGAPVTAQDQTPTPTPTPTPDTTTPDATATPTPTPDDTSAPAPAKGGKKKGGKSGKSGKSGKPQFTGSITAIDATAKTLTVQSKSGDLALTVTSDTVGGDALSSMTVGEKISGSYTTDASGKMTATMLEKAQPKGKKGGKSGKSANSSGSSSSSGE